MRDVRSDLEVSAQWRAHKYLYHSLFFEQFKTTSAPSGVDEWPLISTVIAAMNRQYGSVNQMTQQMVDFMASKGDNGGNGAFIEPGFVWLLCDGETMQFQFTPRYDALDLGAQLGVVLAVDIWSHSVFPDFVRGRRAKKAEWETVRRRKYRTHERVGQAIDVQHIGSSEQKAFNFARSRVEVFGYYINAIVQNLDWLTVARRWESQCSTQSQDSKPAIPTNTAEEATATDAVHREL